jgi:type IV secretory pathway protease TraF
MFQPRAPVRRCGVADVRHRKVPGARRRGIPRRIIAISRPLSVLRTTGVNWRSEDSLDGRYFGLVPNSSVIGKALPVWTSPCG